MTSYVISDFSRASGALEDFSKSETAVSKKDDKEATAEAPQDAEGEVWSEEFIKQAAAQFESNMSNLMGNIDGDLQLTPEQLQQSFQKMAGTIIPNKIVFVLVEHKSTVTYLVIMYKCYVKTPKMLT